MVKIKPVRVIKRNNNYQLDFYNLNGERRRITAGNNLQIAQRMSLRFTDFLIEGKDPEIEIIKQHQKEKAKSITLEEFFPVFFERHGKQRSKSMQNSYQYSFNNISRCPNLLHSSLGSINRGLVLEYMHARIKNDKVTNATVNREAAFMKCMITCAVDWEFLSSNQLYGLKLLPEAEKRDVYVSKDEIKRLLDELSSPVSDIVEFAIYTGFRKENILSLKIENIRFNKNSDFAQVELVVKGNRRKLFGLGSSALDLLKRVIGNRNSGYIFLNLKTGTRFHCIKKSFNQAVKRVGLTVNGTKFRFHDLRHVFATWLHNNGVTLDELRPLMGHSSRSTTDKYATIDNEAVTKLLNRIPQIRDNGQKNTLINDYQGIGILSN
ncbi:tyrosine-type recombinase/integrase [candidate division KSB1 bacterium]